jgi:hypothetical protein
MREFNEALHPRAPKGTEEGGQFTERDFYTKKEKERQQVIAKRLREKLLDKGIYVFEPNTSVTNYGVSTYLTYKDLNNEEYKFRISDHSVENFDRIINEFHYDEKTNLDEIVNKFSARVIGNAYLKNEREFLFKRQKIKEKKLSELRSNLFNGLIYKRESKSLLSVEEFKKKYPEAKNINIIKKGSYATYEYTIDKKYNEDKKYKYTHTETEIPLNYLENINNFINKHK